MRPEQTDGQTDRQTEWQTSIKLNISPVTVGDNKHYDQRRRAKQYLVGVRSTCTLHSSRTRFEVSKTYVQRYLYSCNSKYTWYAAVIRVAKPLRINALQAPRHASRVVTPQRQFITKTTQPTTCWSRRSPASHHCVTTTRRSTSNHHNIAYKKLSCRIEAARLCLSSKPWNVA